MPLLAYLAQPLVKLGLVLSLLAALFLGGVHFGYKWGTKSLREAVRSQEQYLLQKQAKRDKVTSQVVVQYVNRVVTVREKAQEIIKEVPVYVKDSCTLSTGVRLLHDAATQGHLPGTE